MNQANDLDELTGYIKWFKPGEYRMGEEGEPPAVVSLAWISLQHGDPVRPAPPDRNYVKRKRQVQECASGRSA
jgi:hypothetical protein